jgi:hypothetical protein
MNSSDSGQDGCSVVEKQWGIQPEDCKIGHLAIIEMTYGPGRGKGIEVMRITEISELVHLDVNSSSSSSNSCVSTDNSDRCYVWVTGKMFAPRIRRGNAQTKCNQASCLEGGWLLTKNIETHKNWAIMHVFPNLTKNEGKLPQPAVNKVLKCSTEKVVFQGSDDQMDEGTGDDVA